MFMRIGTRCLYGSVFFFLAGYSPAAVCTAVWVNRPVPGPGPRVGHAMAYDSNREVVVFFGGSLDGTLHNDTWEWDGSTWTFRSIAGPSPRRDHAMAFDGQNILLFGGSDGSALGDTWLWDGAGWIFWGTGGPSARANHAMVYDSGRNRVVLFGGGGTNETWEWNGTTWIAPAVTGAPGPRDSHGMAYDTCRARTVLWGGIGASVFMDTWEYDGNTQTWSFITNTGLNPRHDLAMAFDVVRCASVLFGGFHPIDGWYQDTFEWQGTSWSFCGTLGPNRRSGHAMAYDSARGAVVMYGGFASPDGHYGDTWEYFPDCNGNSASDPSEPGFADCNANGRWDACDIATCPGEPACADCNNNGVLDECDITSCAPGDNTCGDCNGNGVPDECDLRAEQIASGGQSLGVTLFADSFDDGDDVGWTITQGDWEVVGDVYRPTGGQRNYAYAGDSSWTDYALDADVVIGEFYPQGTQLQLSVRVDPSSNPCVDHGCSGRQYLVLLMDSQQVVLRYAYGPGTVDVLSVPYDLAPYASYHLTIMVTEDTICTSINGVPIFEHTFGLPEPIYSTGVIAVSHYREDGAYAGAYVDNIVVTSLVGSAACDTPANDCNNNGIPDECEPDCNFNGVPDPCEAQCVADGDCDDASACTCDRCVCNVCVHQPIAYGDVNCNCVGAVDVDDISCVLDGYTDYDACPGADIFPPCTGNGFIDIDDIVAVLDAFAGINPCFQVCGVACPIGACCDGSTCTEGDWGLHCVEGGNTYQGDGTICASSPCP